MIESVPPSPLRLEDDRLLRGQGRFVEDIAPAGCLHAVFVRAPVAHARIASIDADAAFAMTGVEAVLTGADLVADGVNPLRCARPMDSSDGTPFNEPARHALATDRVRFAGEAVALVLADTAAHAEDAAEAVIVDYDEEPVCIDPLESDDVAFVWRFGDAGTTDAAFAQASRIVTFDQRTNRIAAMPLETRSAVGNHDAGTGAFELRTQTQGVHFTRAAMAATLGIEQAALRVVTGDVGGSFGMKLIDYPEQVAVLAAARRTGRAVRWVSSRSEAMLSDVHAREHASRLELALDERGRFLALRVRTHGNLGAYASAFSTATAAAGFARTLGNVYRIPAIDLTVHGVYTNTTPIDAFRGAGKPESVHLMERLVDKAAIETGIDRFDLRRANLVTRAEMPYRAATGATWDDGDFAHVMDAVLAQADWPGFASRRAASERNGRRRGFGLGLYIHVTGTFGPETSTVRLTDLGRVEVRSGSQSIGQGHETSFAQLVGDRLGIAASMVDIRQGDSADLPEHGAVTGGSSSLQIAGVNMVRAADDFVERLKPHAADALEAAAGDIVYREGRFLVDGTDRAVSLADLGERLRPGEMADCAGSADFSGDPTSVPYGAYACEVEVDPDTGAVSVVAFHGVDDVGRRINAAIVEGQLHGAIAQGIGQGLMERMVHDQTGQLLTGSLMDYALPRADDLPDIHIRAADIPTKTNILGTKGVGELGCIGTPGAFMNAVCDAIATQEIEMPASPERVWRALRGS